MGSRRKPYDKKLLFFSKKWDFFGVFSSVFWNYVGNLLVYFGIGNFSEGGVRKFLIFPVFNVCVIV